MRRIILPALVLSLALSGCKGEPKAKGEAKATATATKAGETGEAKAAPDAKADVKADVKAEGETTPPADFKPTPPPEPPALSKDDAEKTAYVVGVLLARQLDALVFSPKELEMLKQGLADAAGGKKLAIQPDQFQMKVSQLGTSRRPLYLERQKKQGGEFLQKMAKEKGAETLPSGVVYVPVKEGTGAQPKENDTVKVHYTGRLSSGTIFDTSAKNGKPGEFPLNGVVKCWGDGVGKMKVGGKAKLGCPAATAYGDMGRPPVIPPGSVLTFEVELLEVVPPPPPPPPAPDQAKKK